MLNVAGSGRRLEGCWEAPCACWQPLTAQLAVVGFAQSVLKSAADLFAIVTVFSLSLSFPLFSGHLISTFPAEKFPLICTGPAIFSISLLVIGLTALLFLGRLFPAVQLSSHFSHADRLRHKPFLFRLHRFVYLRHLRGQIAGGATSEGGSEASSPSRPCAHLHRTRYPGLHSALGGG